MYKKQKQQKGITLVALIVTIIILLILAGISIASLTGNGLFEKAKLAKEKQENAQIKENTILDDYENKIGQYINGSNRDNKLYDKNIYDVWLTWLSLAGIENPEAYNGQKILSNEGLMQTVMNNENALEYLVNSREFIWPSVLNSETALTKLYESSKIVKVPKLQEKVDRIIYNKFNLDNTNSGGTAKLYFAFDNDYTTVASTEVVGASSIGSYIGYDFGKAVNVFKVEGKIRMKGYKIQYSDDKENWIDCIENTLAGSNTGDTFSEFILENYGKHRYWRLYVNGGQQKTDWAALVYELQFYGV